MEIYTGIDIIETKRIKKAIENKKFIEKIYTKNEIEYCESKNNNAKIQSYSARFAAKEAIFKAISKILEKEKKIKWQDIEILKEKSGRPYANLKINNEQKQKIKIDISISHVKEYAIATAIVKYKDN